MQYEWIIIPSGNERWQWKTPWKSGLRQKSSVYIHIYMYIYVYALPRLIGGWYLSWKMGMVHQQWTSMEMGPRSDRQRIRREFACNIRTLPANVKVIEIFMKFNMRYMSIYRADYSGLDMFRVLNNQTVGHISQVSPKWWLHLPTISRRWPELSQSSPKFTNMSTTSSNVHYKQ